MSDEQERDAAVIARYREALVWIMREESGETVSLKTANRSREMFDVRHRDFADAALRTINRLATERDVARAACELVASSLEANLGYAVGKPYFWGGPEGREIVQHTLRNAANNLREALGSEAGSLQTAVADVNAGRTRPAHELLEELRNESEENE